jgi:hypothetical protein
MVCKRGFLSCEANDDSTSPSIPRPPVRLKLGQMRWYPSRVRTAMSGLPTGSSLTVKAEQ